MEKIKKFLKNDKLFNFIIFPFIVLLLADVFYKANGIILSGFTNYAYIDCFISIFKFPNSFLIAYFIIVSFNALLLVLFNNSKISKIVLMSMMLILVVINDFKFVIMEIPIRISDIFYLNGSNGGMMMEFLNNVKGNWMIKILFKSIGVIIILILLVKYDKRFNTKFNKTKHRIVVGIISIICLILPWVNSTSFSSFYLDTFYSKKQNIGDTDIIKTYYNYGFIQGIYYYYLKDTNVSPNNYSKAEAILSMENTVYEENDSWVRPNVVIILSESLGDANNLEDISFDKELLSNMEKFKSQANTQTFNLLSPTYGGASVNTEFEILTGANLSFFNTGYVPYNQLYNDENSPYLPNIIKEFNNNGYITKYITAWGPDSYRSSYVYDKFEVSEKIYNKDLDEPIIKGDNIADSYMMDVIIEELTNKEATEKKFIFVATGQNHVPYRADRYEEYDVAVTKSNYSKEDTELLRCYAQGVYDADKELGRLYDEILKLDEPTIVVLYGDHLPYIVNSSGNNVYMSDSYFNTADENINLLRKYTTPASVIANYEIELKQLDFINMNYLGSYIINNLDLEVSDYFKYVNYNMDKFPVYNQSFIYNDGQFLNVNDLPYKERTEYYNMENVQYYKFFDYDEE